MCRFDGLSINRNVYVPGGNTVPGTCTSSVNVTFVVFVHSSACARLNPIAPISAAKAMSANLRTAFIEISSLRLVLGQFCARVARLGQLDASNTHRKPRMPQRANARN